MLISLLSTQIKAKKNRLVFSTLIELVNKICVNLRYLVLCVKNTP